MVNHLFFIKLFSFLSKHGLYLKIFWSSKFWYPSAKSMGIGQTNSFKNHKYRIKLCYLKKKPDQLQVYSNKLNFIIKQHGRT